MAQTLASVTALAGCGIGRGEPTPSAAIKPEAGKLQWMLWNPAANLALYEQVSRAFQEQQSAITLELVAVAGDAGYFDKLKTQLAAGQPVDIVGASPVWVPDVASTGITRELSSFLTRDRAFKIGDYSKGVIEAASWQGKLHLLTLFSGFSILFYNKGLFDRAGVKYPDETWTLDTLLDAAKRLTQQTGDPASTVYGFDFARDLNNVLPYIWEFGGDAFDRPEAPRRATMSSPATLAALTWLTDMVVRLKVAPGDGGAPIPSFTTGQIAMAAQNAPNVGRTAAAADFPWDIAIFPKGPSGRANFTGGLFYGIAQASLLPDAAWTFLKYLCGPDGQRPFVVNQIGTPVHRAMEQEYLRLPPPPANRKAVTDTLPYLRPLPKTLKMMEMYSPIFGQLMSQAFSGRTSPTEACRRIDEQVAGILGSA